MHVDDSDPSPRSIEYGLRLRWERRSGAKSDADWAPFELTVTGFPRRAWSGIRWARNSCSRCPVSHAGLCHPPRSRQRSCASRVVPTSPAAGALSIAASVASNGASSVPDHQAARIAAADAPVGSEEDTVTLLERRVEALEAWLRERELQEEG